MLFSEISYCCDLRCQRKLCIFFLRRLEFEDDPAAEEKILAVLKEKPDSESCEDD